jgi:hypothetical protein
VMQIGRISGQLKVAPPFWRIAGRAVSSYRTPVTRGIERW